MFSTNIQGLFSLENGVKRTSIRKISMFSSEIFPYQKFCIGGKKWRGTEMLPTFQKRDFLKKTLLNIRACKITCLSAWLFCWTISLIQRHSEKRVDDSWSITRPLIRTWAKYAVINHLRSIPNCKKQSIRWNLHIPLWPSWKLYTSFFFS